jgi:hypothetical protein
MAVKTTQHHVQQAVRFKSLPGLFFCIGRSQAWPDGDVPPPLDESMSAVDGPIGYKRVQRLLHLVPDSSGGFEFNETTWREVDEADAYTEGAIYLYLETRLKPSDFPAVQYRQVGLYSGLIQTPGSPANVLLPNEVTDPGFLEVIEFRAPVVRAPDQDEILSLILRF